MPPEKRIEVSSNALLSASFVLLAVALLSLVYWLTGGEPIATRLERLGKDLVGSVELLKDARVTGLNRVWGTSRDFSGWMTRLISAKRSVDLMGYSLLVWSTGRDFEAELLKLLQRGVDVRVLAIDPNNPHFEALVNSHQIASVKNVAAVKSEVLRAISVFENVATTAPAGHGVGKFELRQIRTGLVVCQLCKVDDWLVSIPYLYSVVASESPLLEIHGQNSDLFRWYTQEFQSLWVLNP